MTVIPAFHPSGVTINPAEFSQALSMFDQGMRRRTDSRGLVSPQESMKEARIEMNARAINEAYRVRFDQRWDSAGFNQSAGYHFARQLEYIHEQVLDEKFAVPTAFELFGMDTSVPAGARTHTRRRSYAHGQAQWYRGPGTEIPHVGSTQREESFNIAHAVAGYGFDIFEEQSATFAQSGKIQKDAAIARDVIMEKLNRAYWGLDGTQMGLYGVLNYPWMPKKSVATAFTSASAIANPDTVLSELHDIVNYPMQVSKGTFAPTELAMSQRVHDVLSNTRMGSGSDRTILEAFLSASAHIRDRSQIHIAWELEDANGTGVDGILAYRKDAQGIQLVMPQGVTQLPAQVNGLSTQIFSYASCGGVEMTEPLNQLLAFVTAA